MIIHTMNEHPAMQANKLNAKYYLHVQHSNDARTQRQLHQGYKIQQGHMSKVLKKCIISTKSTKLHKQRYKLNIVNYTT